jgi:hypothetical protein
LLNDLIVCPLDLTDKIIVAVSVYKIKFLFHSVSLLLIVVMLRGVVPLFARLAAFCSALRC